MTRSLITLLRRTFVGLAALATAAAIPVYAQQGGPSVTKSDGSTICGSGTFTSITMGPNGLVVNCSGTTTSTPGPAGAFAISSNGVALAWNASSGNTFTITRTGGTTGAVTVGFNRGGGCGPLPLDDTVTFTDGMTTANVGVRTPNGDATCVFTLTSATNAQGSTATALATYSATPASVAVNSSGINPGGGTTPPGGGTPPPAGCPAMDTNATRAVSIGLSGVDRYLAPSGTIMYAPLPDPLSSAGFSALATAGKVQFNDATASPSAATKEIWISKCPGVLDSSVDMSNTDANPGKCYISDNTTGTTTALNFFTAPGLNASATDSEADMYSICEAYSSKGKWYINFRWTYSQDPINCPWGVGQCGFTGQLQNSGFAP